MKPKYSSREEQALAEAGRTTISAGQKIFLAAVFLAAVFSVPVYQQIAEVSAYLDGRRLKALPQCYDILSPAFSALKKILRPADFSLKYFFKVNAELLREMRAYENALEDSSRVGRAVRPCAQYLMTRWLGAGNDKTYCGRGAWLFYRPDIEYAVNRGFLENNVMARRAASGSETEPPPHPDPRPAITGFNAELSARGIKLILMPTPVKPVVHPEKFAVGFEGFARPIQNLSYQRFAAGMEKAGIPVFDVAPELVRDKETNKRDQFLAGDTHWRPEAMEHAARLLAAFVKEHAALPPAPAAGYTAERTNIACRGDIVGMLRLPEESDNFGAQEVSIRRVFDSSGRPWRPSRAADILLLGDSFANIYSLEAMGWGGGAGLAEQLSREMQRPVDFLAVNDNGACATRELLARELARGNDHLAGKRAVIWQFAARELTAGDWKIVPLERAAKESSFLSLAAGGRLVVTGEIKAVARAPRPGTVPYSDHIIAARIVGAAAGSSQFIQALVYMFSMTNNTLTPAAGLMAGDRVTLRLRPWAEVSAEYERINRADLDDPELLVQEPCWGELISEGE
ncbi:MAG: hypothetical protein PHP98_00530 [Kiritimatiellae bacterium]|nr:hypothetical protein [Kiritimatiellia bacterium]